MTIGQSVFLSFVTMILIGVLGWFVHFVVNDMTADEKPYCYVQFVENKMRTDTDPHYELYQYMPYRHTLVGRADDLDGVFTIAAKLECPIRK